jgi:uncharacterized protein YraI
MRARSNAISSAMHTATRGCLFQALSLSIVMALCGSAMAQMDINIPAKPAAPAVQTEPGAPAPVMAEVMGNDVNTRSGPGTNFYACGRLFKGDRVQVAKTSDGWTAIVPPKGSYSWVAVQYVSISAQNPTDGIVTGNGVPIYAGSDELEPMVSTSKQDVTLTRGQKVQLLGDVKDEYYKIVPPAGAYLWVSSQYLQPQGQGGSVSIPAATVPGKSTVQIQTPAAATVADANLVGAYYALKAKFDEEQKKPLNQQDYSAIKGPLKAIADKKDGSRAVLYAQYTLARISRIELAKLAGQEVDGQRKELKDRADAIDKILNDRLIEINQSGSKYTVIGKLQPSAIYQAVVGQPQRFQLVDESGKIICYVAPAGPALGKDMASFVGHKVGLIGHVQPQTATARAYVEFSDIELVK